MVALLSRQPTICPFFFSLSHDPTLSPFPDTIEIRDFKKFDKNAFSDALRCEEWLPVFKCDEAN